MRYVKVSLILVCAGLLLLALACGPAVASDSCGVDKAKRDVRAAKRAYVRAAREYREARHVLSATRKYVRVHGQSVGRWTRLARRTGWGWGQFDHLMYVIDRESGGSPKAKNPTSTASGLLQFLAFHWDGSGDYGWRFDPFDPEQNLRYGYKLYKKCGWSPWLIQ